MHPNIQTLPLTSGTAYKSKPIAKQFVEIGVGALSVASALLYTLWCYQAGRFADPTDFVMQREFFGVWGLAALFFGLNVGFTNPDAKFIWTCTDIVWISTALLSLSSILSPVEQHVMGLKAENARFRADSQYHHILNEIAAGVKLSCTKQPAALDCQQWTSLQKEATNQEKSPWNLFARLQRVLPNTKVEAASQGRLDKIKRRQKDLGAAIDDEGTARAVIDEVDISWPYWNILVLTITLGMRAGKTGADIPKSWAEWKKSRQGGSGATWANLTSLTIVAAADARAVANIRDTYIDFIVPDAIDDQSVITLGGDSGGSRNLTVAYSLDTLAAGFPTLARVELPGLGGAGAGRGLVNMGRVRSVVGRDGFLELDFVDGLTLRIVDNVQAPAAERVDVKSG